MARQDHSSWDECFMTIARTCAQRSKDPSRQVGCCIVDDRQCVVSVGYNGFPRGCSDTDFPWDKEGEWLDTKYPYVCHAEANAIVAATRSLVNCTAYVTLFPCNECAKLVIQSGIRTVVYADEGRVESDAHKAAVAMFSKCGVSTRYMNEKKNIP